MATFGETLAKVLMEHKDSVRLVSVNRSVMEVSRGTKNKSGFLKVAASEETLNKWLVADRKEVGFMIFADGDLLKRIADQLDDKNQSQKIIAVDNYGRESIADELVIENVSEYWGNRIVKALNDKVNDDSSRYFKLVAGDYKLWRGMEELV